MDITERGLRAGRRSVCVHAAIGRVGIGQPERVGNLLQFVGAGFSGRPAQPEEGRAARVRTTR